VIRAWTALVCVLGLSAPALAQTEIERDFETFVHWFTGSWDNEIQTFNENFEGIPEEHRHDRIHMEYRAVRGSGFPGVLFVIKNFGADGVRGDLNYVSVHHFFPHIERQAIAHEFWFSKNGDWSHLAENPDAAAALTADDIRFNRQCTMYWTRKAAQFEGTTDPNACITGEGNAQRIVDATGLLSRSDLWRRDLVSDKDGNRVSGHDTFERFRKARYYGCSGRYRDEAGEWVMYDGVKVHNQGDFVWLGGESLGIQLRQIIWTSGFFGNATALQVYVNGAGRAAVNGHGSLNTRYIGIDHPDFVVNCER
jgi:hypothetical protein